MAAGFVILLIIVGALALAAWPVTVLLARRRYRIDRKRAAAPREERPHDDGAGYPHGTVVGGLHVGGGRSVAPRRDAEVTPLQDEGIIPGQGRADEADAAQPGGDGAARRG